MVLSLYKELSLEKSEQCNGCMYFRYEGSKHYLPTDPSQKTKKDLSLLRESPLGNRRFLKRTVVCFVVGSYFRTLPVSSAEKTNCMKFLRDNTMSEIAIVHGNKISKKGKE